MLEAIPSWVPESPKDCVAAFVVEDLCGILGLSNEVLNGYERIRVSFKIKGHAPPGRRWHPKVESGVCRM